MTTRGVSVLIGLALYIALVLTLYALHKLAFSGGSGPYPLWYSSAELLVKGLAAVGPGIVTGWLCRGGSLSAGAIVGIVGGGIEVILLAALTGVPFREFGGRVVLATIATAVVSGITNAVGAIAGEALRIRFKPSNPGVHTDAQHSGAPVTPTR